MNTNKKIMIASLVLIVAAFYGGMKYGESMRLSMFTNRAGNAAFTAGANAQFAGRPGGIRGGAGALFGEILSQDANGITVKTQDGSSKIVLISASTLISKQAAGSASDLSVGKSVAVTGTTNADGSITAQSVQLRPAMMATSTQKTN